MLYERLSSRGGIDLDINTSKSMLYERVYGLSLVWYVWALVVRSVYNTDFECHVVAVLNPQLAQNCPFPIPTPSGNQVFISRNGDYVIEAINIVLPHYRQCRLRY